MDYQIQCEQLVYGKLVGVRGAGYELIAKSPGITPTDAFAIYKEFNGYRPSATANLASFKPAYVIQRLQNGKTVFLRLSRSNEKEPGRGYFLQECYVVLDSVDVLKSTVKPWLWLLGLQITPPSFAKRDDNLPNYIQLDEKKIHKQINQATSLLASNGDFQQSIIIALHHTLYSRPISVSLRESKLDNWVFLTALSLLLPNTKVAETEIYMGQSLPQYCNVGISVVDEKSSNKNIYYLDFSSVSDDLLTLDQVRKSYTNLSWRCLKTNDLQLLTELVATIKDVNIQAPPAMPTTPLDILLWVSTMPTVGLKLARREYRRGKVSIKDWQWLWRESINRFNVSDIRKIFSILVRHTINDWEDADFASWRELIERMPEVISEISIDNELLSNFLEKWLFFTTTFTNNESGWFIALLEDFVKEDPMRSMILLVKWISKADAENLFDSVLRIVRLISQNSILNAYYWDIILSLGKRIEHRTDLLSFREILRAITVDKGLKPLLGFVNMLCNGRISDHKMFELATAFNEMFGSTSKVARYMSDVVNTLFFLSLRSRKRATIIFLAYIISQNKKKQYKRSSMLTEEILYLALNEWILITDNHALIGSFVYLVYRLTWYKGISVQILTNSLLEKSSLFYNVVSFMQKQLHAQRRDLQISFAKLSALPEADQLSLFVEYILSTKNLPYTVTDEKILEYLLTRVCSLEDSINVENQNRLLSIFCHLPNLRICQRILEHQIRSALLVGSVEQSERIYKVLERYVHLMNEGSRFWANSIIRYFRALSEKQKDAFLNWLLKAPLSEPPNIEHKFSFLLTSAILEKKTEWFSNDPVIRLSLFSEAIQIIKTQILAKTKK